MLEPGCRVFDCEVISLLSEDKLFQRYLMRCDGQCQAKLLICHDLPEQEAQRQRFISKVEGLADYDFPALGLPEQVQIVDSGLACLYPLEPGDSLADICSRRVMSAREALERLGAVARLLVAPHKIGLAHGNLSPATIFFDSDQPYLGEFNFAQLIKLDFSSGLDPAYTSPEQVRGEFPGTASDIYNLGCVLYLLLQGKAPFRGEDAFAVAVQHMQDAFPTLADDHCCRDLLEQMTLSGIDERPTIESVLTQIEALLSGDDIDRLAVVATAVEDDGQASETAGSAADDDVVEPPKREEQLDFTARIEARLKQHSFVVPDPLEENPPADPAAATEALEHIYRPEKNRGWRYLLILVAGILLGSGFYFVFLNAPPSRTVADVSAAVDRGRMSGVELDRALEMWREGRGEDAIETLEALALAHPDDPRALNNLAAIAAAGGDYQRARDYLEEALKTDSAYATVYNNLATVYAEMARDSYGKALQFDSSAGAIQLTALSSQGGVTVAANSTIPQAVSEEVGSAPADAMTVDSEIMDTGTEGPVDSDSDKKLESDAGKEGAVVMQAEPPDHERAAEMAGAARNGAPVVEESSAAAPQLEAEPVPVVGGETPQKFIQRWADAWSSQDVDSYLSFYSSSFLPPGGKTRSEWENQRAERITGPRTIDVSLSEISLRLSMSMEGRALVRVEAVQDYKSDRFSDRTRKLFDLTQIDGRWYIQRERSLENIR